MTVLDPLMVPLVWLALAAAIGAGVYARAGAGRRVPALRAYAEAVALVAAAFVMGLALLWVVASRFSPSGSYASWADLLADARRYEEGVRAGFWLLYGLLLLLGGAAGYARGRGATGRGAAPGAATATATLLLLALTFPLVDFISACVANVTVVFRGISC